MKADELYKRLDNDFIKAGIEDDWMGRLSGLAEFIHPGFAKTSMGLMCDFTDNVSKVYATVFLSERILNKIINDGVDGAMIFSHHPTAWDIKNRGGNYAAGKDYFKKLKEKNISVYVLHHPLDNYGEYSTCRTLAVALGIKNESPAFLFSGALCGVIGEAGCDSIYELRERYSAAVGHKTSLYLYGNEDIRGTKIAVCPGGGNMAPVANELLEKNIKILITGVTINNDHSNKIHALEKENHINLLGGTHYSSEKLAPMSMRGYFNKLGIPSEFIGDEPDFNDL